MISVTIEQIEEFQQKDSEVEDNEIEDDELESVFETIYKSLEELDKNCSDFTRQFQECRKKIEAQTLEEQEFFPKKHAVHWFKRHHIPMPCSLNVFLEAFLKEESQKDRICSEERSVILGKQARHLFQTEKKKVGWMELLSLLPKVFE